MCPGTNRTLRMWHVLGYIVVRFAPPLPVARQVKFNCLSQSGRTIVTGGAVPYVYSILLLCSVQPYPHRKQVVNIGSSGRESRASHSGHTLSLYMSLFIFLDVYGFWRIHTGPLELKSINFCAPLLCDCRYSPLLVEIPFFSSIADTQSAWKADLECA